MCALGLDEVLQNLLWGSRIAMDIYQHDSADTFRFVLKGELAKVEVQQLQCAWETAESILNGKDLIIEISGVT